MTGKKSTSFTTRGPLSLVALGVVFAAALLGSPRSAEAQTPPPGQRAFNRTCGRCHPDGGEDTGPEIRGRNLTEARMREVIRTGTRRMRPITPQRLTDADLEGVIAYLRTMHAVAP